MLLGDARRYRFKQPLVIWSNKGEERGRPEVSERLLGVRHRRHAVAARMSRNGCCFSWCEQKWLRECDEDEDDAGGYEDDEDAADDTKNEVEEDEDADEAEHAQDAEDDEDEEDDDDTNDDDTNNDDEDEDE